MLTEEEIEEIALTKAREKIANQKQLRDEYHNAITTLESITNATSPTNAQIVQAVKYMAKVLLFILRHLNDEKEDGISTADIAEINGVVVADISKVNGVSV